MKSSLSLFIKGLCMGTADVVPGVSGGTVALVLGVYERLILAIRHVDVRMLASLVQARFYRRAIATLVGRSSLPALDPVDARADSAAFLVALVAGIGAAVVTGARVIPGLLEAHPESMRALFCGMVLASVIVPWRRIRSRSALHAAVAVLLAAGTFWLVGLPSDSAGFANGEVNVAREGAEESAQIPAGLRFSAGQELHKHAVRYQVVEPVVFAAGQKVATARVVATRAGEDGNLPAGGLKPGTRPEGTDGPAITIDQPQPLVGGSNPSRAWVALCGAIAICAMILPGISGAFLLLLLGQYGFVLFQLHLAVSTRGSDPISYVLAFLGGIAVGILSFTRLLHWLLEHAHDVTMAALVGLMLGSLRKLWPFQEITIDGPVNIVPDGGLSPWGVPLLAFAVGAVVVIGVEIVGSRTRPATQ